MKRDATLVHFDVRRDVLQEPVHPQFDRAFVDDDAVLVPLAERLLVRVAQLHGVTTVRALRIDRRLVLADVPEVASVLRVELRLHRLWPHDIVANRSEQHTRVSLALRRIKSPRKFEDVVVVKRFGLDVPNRSTRALQDAVLHTPHRKLVLAIFRKIRHERLPTREILAVEEHDLLVHLDR